MYPSLASGFQFLSLNLMNLHVGQPDRAALGEFAILRLQQYESAIFYNTTWVWVCHPLQECDCVKCNQVWVFNTPPSSHLCNNARAKSLVSGQRVMLAFAAQQTLQTPSFSLECKIKSFHTGDNHLTQMRFEYLQKNIRLSSFTLATMQNCRTLNFTMQKLLIPLHFRRNAKRLLCSAS